MNMLGMAIAAKGLNEMSRRSGRGGGYYGPSEPTEEEYFLGDCLSIIRECAKMPATEDTIIPVSTTRKRTRAEKKKGVPKEETREIYIAQINPRGVGFEGIETHTGLSPVIGMIDNDKMFVYSTSPEHLEIFVIEEYAYDHLGDYFYRTGNVAKDGLSPDFEEIRTKIVRVYNSRRVEPQAGFTTKPDQKSFSVRENWIKVADIVGAKRRACLERNKEPNAEQMGE